MNDLIVFVASYFYLISIALFAGYFFYAPKIIRRQFLRFSFLVLPFSYLLGLVAKHLYYDPRPFVVLHITPLFAHAADNGFPSDHALLMGALAAIVTVFDTRIGITLWVLAFLVGAARVLASVHHPIDIFASFIIAIVVTLVVKLFVKHREQ